MAAAKIVIWPHLPHLLYFFAFNESTVKIYSFYKNTAALKTSDLIVNSIKESERLTCLEKCVQLLLVLHFSTGFYMSYFVFLVVFAQRKTNVRNNNI